MKRWIAPLTLVMAFWTIAGPARADTDLNLGYVDLRLDAGLGDTVTITAPGFHPSVDAFACPYQYTLYKPSNGFTPASALGTGNSATPGPGNGKDYTGFCIALYQDISIGLYKDFKVVPLGSTMTTDMMINVEKLLYQYQNSNMSGANLTSPAHGIASDALTVAIWEVMNENAGTFDTTSGNVSFKWDNSANSSANTVANGWLNKLNDSTVNANYAALFDPNNVNGFTEAYGLVDGNVQTQSIYIAVLNHNTPSPTPEPSSLVSLAGMGVLGAMIAGAVARRRRRAAVSV